MIERREQQDKATRFKEWLDTRGVKAVLFDLDDTLLDTNPIVISCITAYIDYLHHAIPDIPKEELERSRQAADTEVFKTHSVAIPRWQAMAELIAKKYPSIPQSVFTDGVPILLQIYSALPPMLPGAWETLTLVAKANKKIGLVTHANEAYTRWKIKELGLVNVADHIEVVDEFGAKESKHWKHAIESLGVQPHEALVIGDSVKGDVLAAREAGVKYAVLLPSPVPFYKAGDIPEGVIRAARIGSVIDTLLISN